MRRNILVIFFSTHLYVAYKPIIFIIKHSVNPVPLCHLASFSHNRVINVCGVLMRFYYKKGNNKPYYLFVIEDESDYIECFVNLDYFTANRKLFKEDTMCILKLRIHKTRGKVIFKLEALVPFETFIKAAISITIGTDNISDFDDLQLNDDSNCRVYIKYTENNNLTTTIACHEKYTFLPTYTNIIMLSNKFDLAKIKLNFPKDDEYTSHT